MDPLYLPPFTMKHNPLTLMESLTLLQVANFIVYVLGGLIILGMVYFLVLALIPKPEPEPIPEPTPSHEQP